MRKYTSEYPVVDMKCLKLYCEYKGVKVGEIKRQILNNFLADKAPEIKLLMDQQKKVVESRKKQNSN